MEPKHSNENASQLANQEAASEKTSSLLSDVMFDHSGCGRDFFARGRERLKRAFAHNPNMRTVEELRVALKAVDEEVR